MNDQKVSFDDEKLILVDEHDNIIGYENKDVCHNGDGLLHRAFSIFLFTSNGELLIQQRSQEKRLWGLFWSNTCCSHPRKGETYEQATMRRLQEELGLKAYPEGIVLVLLCAIFGIVLAIVSIALIWYLACG